MLGASSDSLVRALGIPHVPPVTWDVPMTDVTETAPVAGNGPGGRTEGFFQFDRVTNRGRVGAAYHVETPTSDEGQLQMRAFVEAVDAAGAAE